MNLPRRRFLQLAVGAAALLVTSGIARAQTYPTRSVRIIVAAAAGGPTDVIARLVGQRLTERLGRQFIIENRPGGSNNIGTEAVVRAVADGYTLLLVNTVNTVNATLFANLNYNFIRDIAPVAGITRLPLVMEVHPSVPAATVAEFIAYAKANPGRINMASGGNGTAPHMAGELFKAMTGVEIVHVPYRGSAPGLSDLLGGQVQVMFDAVSTSIAYIRTNKLRPLAVTTATRFPALPEVPTVGDFVPGYEATGWYGIGAPRNVPPEVIEKLNIEINAILADPKMQALLADNGGMSLAGSPADFGRLIGEETAKWAKLIRRPISSQTDPPSSKSPPSPIRRYRG